MKSSHSRNNNESEPDVEFVPTRSSTHTYMAVASDDTTTRNENFAILVGYLLLLLLWVSGFLFMAYVY